MHSGPVCASSLHALTAGCTAHSLTVAGEQALSLSLSLPLSLSLSLSIRVHHSTWPIASIWCARRLDQLGRGSAAALMDRGPCPPFVCPPVDYPRSPALSLSLSLSPSLSVCLNLSQSLSLCTCVLLREPVCLHRWWDLKLVRLDDHGATCPTCNAVGTLSERQPRVMGEEDQPEAGATPREPKSARASAPLTSAPLNMLMAFFAAPSVAITTSAVAADTDAQTASNQHATE